MKKGVSLLLLISVLGLTACETGNFPKASDDLSEVSIVAPYHEQETEPSSEPSETVPAEDIYAEPNGQICILFTSDVHCGIDEGFGYAGLYEVREHIIREGYSTILVDDGDAIQGGLAGTLTEGEDIIGIMNEMEYDVAVPGNHEFDYGVDRFLELAGQAEFPYVCCNFSYEGSEYFDPYIIIERAGLKIAFVGILTPDTMFTTDSRDLCDEDGNLVCDFMYNDNDGTMLYQAVQDAVDSARAEGADYVFAVAHLGNNEECVPFTFADVIENTSGIDAFFDGHSHDTEQLTAVNAEGEEITRYAVGTKLDCIGYMYLSPEDGITSAGIWTWNNDVCAQDLLDIENPMTDLVNQDLADLDERCETVVASSPFDLLINDPERVAEDGTPLRIIRTQETNLGDLSADAIRICTGADIALANAGGIRSNIEAGDITYGNIIDVHPFGDQVNVIEASGQQILDALEWGARSLPDESGSFIQVSGLTYDIDVSVVCSFDLDDDGQCAGINGPRRVSNVTVGDEPIDPNATYTVAGWNFLLFDNGDGNTAFDGCNVISRNIMIDNQALINYITDNLNGVISDDYSNPYGQGRINITGMPEEDQ